MWGLWAGGGASPRYSGFGWCFPCCLLRFLVFAVLSVAGSVSAGFWVCSAWRSACRRGVRLRSCRCSSSARSRCAGCRCSSGGCWRSRSSSASLVLVAVRSALLVRFAGRCRSVVGSACRWRLCRPFAPRGSSGAFVLPSSVVGSVLSAPFGSGARLLSAPPRRRKKGGEQCAGY